MESEPIIYIVEDDEAVRRVLEMIVSRAGFETRTFSSAEAFLDHYDGYDCGCFVFDLRLGATTGLELLSTLRARGSKLPALIISGQADIPAAVRSIKLGAYDFLEKPVGAELLLSRIEEAITQAQAADLARALPASSADRLSQLTPRELEILKYLVAGRSSKQIAMEMKLSLKTVSNHRAHLLAKSGAENTAELVRIAVTAGIA